MIQQYFRRLFRVFGRVFVAAADCPEELLDQFRLLLDNSFTADKDGRVIIERFRKALCRDVVEVETGQFRVHPLPAVEYPEKVGHTFTGGSYEIRHSQVDETDGGEVRARFLHDGANYFVVEFHAPAAEL